MYQAAHRRHYYPKEPGHNIGTFFYNYLLQHEGLFVNGYPSIEGCLEKSSDTKTCTIQQFERTRFEYHPESKPPYDVLPGFLDRQM